MSNYLIGKTAGPSAAGPDGAPPWLLGGRIPCLDGLRALAILLVLFSHLAFPGSTLPPVAAVHERCGFLGVQIFFVLSGFLITTLMLREIGRSGRLSLRHFYWRRFLRIVPIYLVYLGVLAALQVCGQTRLSGRAWFSLTTYTVNFLPGPLPITISHIWSLSVEEHFYILWPLLVALWPLARCRKTALVCVGGALALRWTALLAFPGLNRGAIDLWTCTRIDDIAVGCLLAILARDPGGRGRLDRFVADGRRLAAVAAAFLASQVLCSHQASGLFFPAVVVNLLVGLANDANSLTIAVFLWALLSRPGGACGQALNQPLVRFIGVISYSLYLWHPLFLGRGPDWLCSFPLNLVFMFATAVLSYLLIERPLLALKARADSPVAARPTSRAAVEGPGGDRRRPTWAAAEIVLGADARHAAVREAPVGVEDGRL